MGHFQQWSQYFTNCSIFFQQGILSLTLTIKNVSQTLTTISPSSDELWHSQSAVKLLIRNSNKLSYIIQIVVQYWRLTPLEHNWLISASYFLLTYNVLGKLRNEFKCPAFLSSTLPFTKCVTDSNTNFNKKI